MMGFDLEETRYGFRWGPMRVSRSVSDDRYGVEIMVATPEGEYVFIRVTPAGRKIEVRWPEEEEKDQ